MANRRFSTAFRKNTRVHPINPPTNKVRKAIIRTFGANLIGLVGA